MRQPSRYLCGVPSHHCTGGLLKANGGLGGISKAHLTPADAFKCMQKHLIAEGWTQLGPREFCQGDGPVRILTKSSRFGARMIAADKEKSTSGKRHHPNTAGSGTISSL